MRFQLRKFFLFLIVIIVLVLSIEIGESSPVIAIDNFQPLFEKALHESKDGDFSQALNDWNDFLELVPDDAAAISNRGNCLLALGDPDGAIAAQTRAIALLNLNPDAYLNRGIAYEALEKWEHAANDYQWIIERYPNEISALYNLANVKIAQGDWSMAKTLFDKASLIRPGLIMARSSKLLIQYQLGEFDEVESELRLLIRRYPMFADARAALSALLWRKGFYGEAESHWAAAIGLDSRYTDKEWLLNIRRWPPIPTNDLITFLDLRTS